MQERCLNVIVYYNNYDEVNNYLTEIKDISEGKVDVALVVNKNTDGELDQIIKQHMNFEDSFLTVCDFKGNIGYLNSLLNVIEKVKLDKYKYFILSNTDIHYPQREFFSRLLTNQYENNVGCIAPCVYATKTQSYSNPHYMERIPKKKFLRLASIFRYPSLAKLYLNLAAIKNKHNKKAKKLSCYVYSPHGCYMIFTNGFMQKIVGYKYSVTMYSEESCVGELLNRNQLKCFYDNSLDVQHQESSVTGKIDYRKRFGMWRDSILHILDEFYSGE